MGCPNPLVALSLGVGFTLGLLLIWGWPVDTDGWDDPVFPHHCGCRVPKTDPDPASQQGTGLDVEPSIRDLGYYVPAYYP